MRMVQSISLDFVWASLTELQFHIGSNMKTLKMKECDHFKKYLSWKFISFLVTFYIIYYFIQII